MSAVPESMQQDLLKTADRVAEAHCTKAVREAAEAGEWPAALWGALEQTGMTRAALPESAGGAGLDFIDAMAVLRRTAYHALPVPLAETMMAGRMLMAAGLDVPEGALTVAFVDGKRVPWGGQAAYVVLVGDEEVGLASEVSVKDAEKNLAGEPRVLIAYASTKPKMLAGARDRLMMEGALLRSVQMAGALERILGYALTYANERVQFGRPIGKFQAVQHLLAVLAGQVAAASAAADAAVEASAAAPDEFTIAAAKARVGEAAGKGAEIAHQVHGAMGFTREHNLHYSTRRLWSWRDEFGNEAYWQMRLGRMVAARGAEALWPMLAGSY
ncbi:MAG: acyl-CoA dehydrogenase family protein [Burkholderiales bacterium]